MTLKCIYIRNPLSFNLFPKNLLIDSNLILAAPILLTLSSITTLLAINWLTISCNYPTVIGCYKLVSAILVSPNLKVVAAVNGVVVAAFGGMLFDFLYLLP